jgi:hypothetical protein
MRSAIRNILYAAALVAGTPAITLPATTFLTPKLLVENLPTRSDLADNTSQDLLLRTDRYGSAFLYVEQQQGALLAVFDVTEPEHIKLAAAVSLPARAPYDFVAPVGSTAELIAFRDGSGTAIVDLRKPKSPSLSANPTNGLIEPLGSVGYLSSTVPQPQTQTVPLQPRNVQLIESSRHPRVLVSLTSVTRQAERTDTGTIFLLAEGKVIVIRRIEAREYQMDQVLRRNGH